MKTVVDLFSRKQTCFLKVQKLNIEHKITDHLMRQQVYFIISDHVGSISRSRIDPSDNEPWNQKLLSDIVH